MKQFTWNEYIEYISKQIPQEAADFATGWFARDELLTGIFVPRVFVDLCKGFVSDAFLLSQIHYWSGRSDDTKLPRIKHWHEDHLWIVKQYTEWQIETGIPAETCRDSMKRLSERLLIIKETHLSPYHTADNDKPAKALYVRLNWNELFKAIVRWQEQTVVSTVTYQTVDTTARQETDISTATSYIDSHKDLSETKLPPSPQGGAVEAIDAFIYANTQTPARILRAVPKPTRPEKEKKSNWRNKNSRAEATEYDPEKNDMPTRKASLPLNRAITPANTVKTQEHGKMKESDSLSDWWMDNTGRKQISTDVDLEEFRESFSNPVWREAAEELIAKAVEGSLKAYGKKPKDTTLVERLQQMNITEYAGSTQPKVVFPQFPMEAGEHYDAYKVRLQAMGITHEAWETE